MYTQCPHCDAIFQVSTAQLKAANGEVRCGQCLTVFNALNHLSDEIPASMVAAPRNDIDDTGEDDPWADHSPTTADLDSAADAPASDDAIVTTTDYDAAPDEVHLETSFEANTEAKAVPINDELDANDIEATVDTASTESSDDSIFSEVIAEAGQHKLPTEEMDRFEEFLSTDTLIDDATSNTDSDSAFTTEPEHQDINATEFNTDELNTAEVDTEIQAETSSELSQFDDTANGPDFGAEDAAIIIDEADLAPIASEDYTDKLEFDASANTENSPEESLENGEKNNADNNTDNNIDNEIDSDTLIAESGSSELGSNESDSNPDSPLGESAEQPARQPKEPHTEIDDFSELEEAAAEISEATPTESAPVKPDNTSASDETRDIPHFIMEDLHAAKAEQLRPSNAPWVIGSLVLMLALVLQVVYFSRDELAKDAKLRPWLIQACQLANCTLTQPYDIKQIDIIGREVRSHPTAPKALLVSTTLINNASFMQPFPLLTLVFSDINGKPMAQRRFTPREYLSNTADLSAGMTPDLPVRIELELVDPGKAAVNYEFHTVLDPRNSRPLI